MATKKAISPAQMRAARSWLGMSQQGLADAAGVNRKTIIDFESGLRTPFAGTLTRISEALEKAGIEFLFDASAPAGIRARKKSGEDPKTCLLRKRTKR
jgi:transcriptional regulator with XRE-family HTH domain